MEDIVNQYLFDPTIGRLVTAAIGIVVVIVMVRFLQRISSKYLNDPSSRYRAKKSMTFLGYIIAVVVV